MGYQSVSNELVQWVYLNNFFLISTKMKNYSDEVQVQVGHVEETRAVQKIILTLKEFLLTSSL